MRDLHKLKTFAAADVFHVVVESPRGSVVKQTIKQTLARK